MSDKLTIEDLEEAKKILEDNQKKTPFINTIPELLLNLDRENKELKAKQTKARIELSSYGLMHSLDDCKRVMKSAYEVLKEQSK
jgi:hypothetical protein